MKKQVMIIIGAVLSCYYIGIAIQKGDESQMFKHKKYLSIIGQDWEKDQIDYPVAIHVLKGDGENQGMTVHLGADNVRNDFGDVRFYDETGPLPYWQEKTEQGKQAIFWVKIRKIPRNGTVNIRLEYGNPDVKTASDGKSAFYFFDDFLTDCAGNARAYGKNANYPPGWWMTGLGNGNWIVTNSILQFRGGPGSHLTTEDKVWMSPNKECYTLRFRAKWPDPAWVNPRENGISVGACSWDGTDGNVFMILFGLYRERPNRPYTGKTSVSFGNMPDIPRIKELYPNLYPNLFSQTNIAHAQVFVAINGIAHYKIEPYAKAYKGDFFTFEIERKTKESIGRIIETDEVIRSDYVIDDPMSLMIHGCHYNFPESPYISIDWMLLRKQAYPNPVYGGWSDSLKK